MRVVRLLFNATFDLGWLILSRLQSLRAECLFTVLKFFAVVSLMEQISTAFEGIA